MGENTEAAKSVKLVQAVEHAITAMRVLCSPVTDVDLPVKALQGINRWQIAQQMALGSRKLDRGNHEQSKMPGGGHRGRDTTDLIMIGYSDDLKALLSG